MKHLPSATKWGDREPSHVKLTENLKTFMFKHLQMDPNTKKKVYPQKLSEQDFVLDPQLPADFITKITDSVGSEYVSSDLWSRIQNSLGRGYIDLLYTRLADIPEVVELVVYPRSHDDVVMIVKLANEYQIPLSIVAGSSSVTSGIQPPSRAIAVNLSKMNKILTIQKDSLYIIAQTGISGPELERILNNENLTLGHFPQSFEYSCLGGWVVTRGAGQNSTLYGKIETMVMGVKLVTGTGETFVTHIVPARSTGPDWNQLVTGSEGAFGILTEVTLRVWKKPETIKLSGFFFRTFEKGLEAIRNLLQDGYQPAILRLSDAEETHFNILASTLMKEPPKESFINRVLMKYLTARGYHEEDRCLSIMSFEGNSDLVKLTRKKAIKHAKKHGGFHLGSSPGKSWFKTRYEAPFLRDPIVDFGILVETFETSTTWDKLLDLYYAVRKALKPECPVLWAHCSHFYQNGANLYFTLITPQETGKEIEQYFRIKKRILDTFLKYNGTISHHHGIGRAFGSWLPKEIGKEGIRLLKNMKETLDPKDIMNPGIFNIE